ncbi:redoxin domain-containing protein [Sporosarcina sp. ACRSM]|uniref:redoxin domain-containing protein n=1 Tax=Sporosarcina sp. ACRSM TaxID=2918216 RepID=UPI001EF6E39D|nr:redoxin domain-containing protein [Sporosarcina sp. ACRSM]MCG7334309.1 redoxin domain-containing protein [Sporosarcina sp. ACRSM]
MKKKMIGSIIAALLIGSMIVIMVKSNLDNEDPLDNYIVSADYSEDDGLPGLEKGSIPPDFVLSSLSGETFRLSDLKGKKVVLNFWASWCGPCKAEMPHMQKYYEKNKDKENVEIVAVNLSETERRGQKGIEEFVDAYGLTFPIPLDKEGAVMKAYKVLIIPTTYFIGTDGKVGQRITGPMDEKRLTELVDQLD